MEAFSFKTELIKEENSSDGTHEGIILKQPERVKEEFKNNIKNLKIESEFILNKEITEFIDDQFNPKYDHCINEYKHIYSLSNETNNFKEQVEDKSKENKEKESVNVLHYGDGNDTFYNKKWTIGFSDGDQDVIKEELKFEEHDPFLENPKSSFISEDGFLFCKDGVSLTNEHLLNTDGLDKNQALQSTQEKLLDHHFTEQDESQYNCHRRILEENGKEPPCSEGEETLVSQKQLETDTKVFHESIKLKSLYNPSSFDKERNLKSHMQSHKGVFKKKYICDVCGQFFKFRSNLYRHMNIHSGHKPHSCDSCGKQFSRREHLRLHYHIHTHPASVRERSKAGDETLTYNASDVEQYVCELCGRAFRIKQRLRDHLKLHTNNQPHICKVCNRAFKQKYNLQQHLLGHEGTRGFVCDVCNKGFKRKAFLKQHMLVHTKEKKYVCEICGKRYYKSCHVTAHKRNVHNNNELTLYTCDTCNRVFQRKAAFAKHVLSHLK